MIVSKKLYRIQHQRCIGTLDVVLLQNRLIEAENAAQALRSAMGKLADAIEIRNDDLALADTSTPATCFDFWKAELDEYWQRYGSNFGVFVS
jgi:hypothetical protein